ncbi:uncharacterized protein LOC143915217 [Arctopsyche grandis]|uniref:uncharacterized protein LOC143915217 n=1 Tax=Arctopsyche grandis TaxID=121162 RepID=UPI00406D6863
METHEACLNFPIKLEKIKCEPDTAFYSIDPIDNNEDEYSSKIFQNTSTKLKDPQYSKQPRIPFQDETPVIVKQENSFNSERESTGEPVITSESPKQYESEYNFTSTENSHKHNKYECQDCKRHFETEKSFNFHAFVCDKIDQDACKSVRGNAKLKRNDPEPKPLDTKPIKNDTEKSLNEELVKRDLFQCCICSAYFPNKILLHNHVCGKVRKISYPCSFCPREFSLKSCLTNHMKIHKYEPGRALKDCPSDFLKIPYSIGRIRSKTFQDKNIVFIDAGSSGDEFILPND